MRKESVMEQKPFLSVIMPVYNAEAYVAAAVRSVLRQTFRELELICVNDCSKDGSLSVLQALAAEDSRLRIIDSPVNVGAGCARNLGLEAATGEYITFVDADDSIEPRLYTTAVKACQEGSFDQVVWGLTEEHYDPRGRHIRSVPVIPEECPVTDPAQLPGVILELEDKTLFGYQWNSLYRGSILRKHGIRFEKALLYEDFFFNLAFAEHMQTLCVLPFNGYRYFKRVNGSITQTFTRDYFGLSCRRISELYGFCQRRECDSDGLYRILGNRLLRYTLSALRRNVDPRSGMDGHQRKQWFRDVCQMPLYRQLLPRCAPSHPAHAVLRFSILHGIAAPALLLGRLLFLLKK